MRPRTSSGTISYPGTAWRSGEPPAGAGGDGVALSGRAGAWARVAASPGTGGGRFGDSATTSKVGRAAAGEGDTGWRGGGSRGVIMGVSQGSHGEHQGFGNRTGPPGR